MVRCRITSFQDWLLKPLGHLSMPIKYTIIAAQSQVVRRPEKRGRTFCACARIYCPMFFMGGIEMESLDGREWDIDDYVFGDEEKTVSER